MLEKVKEIIREQKDVPAEKITMDANLTDDLGLDSMDQYLMVASLEDELGVEFPDEAFETIKTVGDAVKNLEEMEK